MKSISTSLRRASAAAALGLAAAAAHATPVVWQLDNVKFTDGASATGSFTFDADTLSYSAWSIQTTNGMFAGQTYDTSTSSTYSALNSAHHFFINLLNNSRYLTFDLVGDLTNAGGAVAIRTPAGNSARDGSFECLNCAP
ncbi:hypothetical protein [Roseateles sp. BYS87W]|uniref:PEP-CTERM sorting domain-containing protein n=1 Tax=Pelomonas baiyunensis TaxID=3299026 RepID=A0ABW7GVD8_9BURK